jgi:plasmid stabilization system protein ParE
VKVRLLQQAYDDLDRFESFLLPKNPDAAQRAVDLLLDAAASLSGAPGKGRPVGRGFRELIVPFGRAAYIMRYRVDETRRIVFITQIWHSREDR